jgi:trans-2,3-dihydro-3-hydroxyanthranilate isomerase
LAGNQLAVFTDGPSIAEELLQAIAREMNFSETVFVYPPTDRNADFSIRIFTPKEELPFAGHPILGAAFVLASERGGEDNLRLKAKQGIVPVRLERQGQELRFGWMIQPVPTFEPYEDPDPLLKAIGVERPTTPIDVYDNGVKHLFIGLESEAAVSELAPDMQALVTVAPEVGVNCFAGAGQRWKTRMFGPGLGVAEDPATGSAAGSLAVHLARYERTAFDTEIEISQGTELGRPSVLYAKASGTADRIEKVEVGGSAVIVARGELTLP